MEKGDLLIRRIEAESWAWKQISSSHPSLQKGRREKETDGKGIFYLL